MSRRALVVRYEGFPFAIRMSKVLSILLECDFEVDVIVPEDRIGNDTYSTQDGRTLRDQVNIITFKMREGFCEKIKAKVNPSFVTGDRYFNACLEKQLRSGSYDLIILKDTHKLEYLFNIIDKRGLSDVRVMCDMYENASEQAYDMYYRYGRPWRKALTVMQRTIPRIRKIESRYLPRCDRVFVVVDEAARYLKSRYNLDMNRISVVENVEFLKKFDSITVYKGFGEFISPDKRIVSYVGSIGAHRGIDLFIEAVSRIPKAVRSRAAFVIVGARNKQSEKIRNMAGRYGIEDDIHIAGYLPHEDAMRWIKKSSIGVIPHNDTEFIRTTVPNKLFQYMAASALIITSNVGPLSRIVSETDCGLIFRAGSSSDFADRIMEALQNDKLTDEKGRNGRIAAENKYCWEKRSEAYQEYFSTL